MTIMTLFADTVILAISAVGVFGFGLVSYGILKGYDR